MGILIYASLFSMLRARELAAIFAIYIISQRGASLAPLPLSFLARHIDYRRRDECTPRRKCATTGQYAYQPAERR